MTVVTPCFLKKKKKKKKHFFFLFKSDFSKLLLSVHDTGGLILLTLGLLNPFCVILSLPLIQEGQLSVSCERMYTILVNRLED